MPRNPYGARPGGGISLSGEYRPTPSVTNRNYFPPNEPLAEGEMRVSFPGSTPWPPTLSQSGTAVMVELGVGELKPRRFFFDMGNGSVKNILGLGVLPMEINDIFITHLHVDHFGALPYLWAFGTWSGGWHDNLHVYGPSGRTPEYGTERMVEGMRMMMGWHIDAFDVFPAGKGWDIKVHQFDFRDNGGVVYEKDGVKVTAFTVNHGDLIKPAYGYRVDYDGRSVVISGDTKFDRNLIAAAKGADLIVHEVALASDELLASSEQFRRIVAHHTTPEEAGIVFAEVNPKLAVYTHFVILSGPTIPEAPLSTLIPRTRTNYDGPLVIGEDLMSFDIGDTISISQAAR